MGSGGKEERPAELSFVQNQAISGPFKWILTFLREDSGTEQRHLWGRDLQPPRGIWAAAAGRIKHFNRDRTCPKSEEAFRSPLVPTIPWLLHQLWVFLGAAPVTPISPENLGLFWERGGPYLGRTVASLLNLAAQPFPGVNMEIRVNKTHGGKMYDSNLH